MASGDGQLYEIILSDYPAFKLYHYITGTSSDKAIWSDAAKTTPLAQPAVADANGVLSFYADGSYRMLFKDSTDANIPNLDLDEFLITADFSTTFEANQGTVLPSASATNIGHPFLLLDVSNNILGMYRSDGTQYKAMNTFTASGDQLFEGVLTNGMPVYNIQHADFGAIPGEALDQTARIKLAVTAIENAGGGVLYGPQGEYQMDSSLIASDTPIVFWGDGKGMTVFKQTANPSAAMIAYSTSDIKDRIVLKGLTLATTVVGSDTAIEASWPSTAGELDYPNLLIDDVEIVPLRSSSATAYFTDYIKISDGKKARITNSFLRGTDDGSTNGTGITTSGDTRFLEIDHCQIHYLNKAIVLTEDTEHVDITNNRFNVADIGVDIDVSASMEGFNISDNKFVDMQTNGIKSQGSNVPTDVTMDNNKITKDADSTNDFRGIEGDFDNYTIRGNIIRDEGSASGTDYAFEVDTATDGTISDNIMLNLDKGVVLTANSSDNIVTDNYMDNANPVTDDSGTDNVLYDNQNKGSAVGGISSEINTVTTTDAGTATTIWSKVMAAGTSYYAVAEVIADSLGVAVASYSLVGTADDTIIRDNTIITSFEAVASYNAAFSVAAGVLYLKVNGQVATTVNWKSRVTLIPVS